MSYWENRFIKRKRTERYGCISKNRDIYSLIQFKSAYEMCTEKEFKNIKYTKSRLNYNIEKNATEPKLKMLNSFD